MDQNTAGKDELARVLLGLHNYANVSLATLYRSRLKVHKLEFETKIFQNGIPAEISEAQARVRAEEANKNSETLQLSQKMVQGYEESKRMLELSLACLTSTKPKTKTSFDDWARVKKNLLSSSKAKVFPPQELARQQQIYDTLTDPAKQDWAYRQVENCKEAHCQTWLGVGSLISRTPVVSVVTKGIAGALGAYRAKRQGLSMWDQLSEGVNAAAFDIQLFETEVSAIERGELRAHSEK